MSKTITGFKGFNSKLQCNPLGKTFQYKVGKTYTEDSKSMCKSGFHFCENPMNVWNFYDVATSRFCRIETDASKSKIDANKIKSVTTEIKILEELNLKEFIQECIKYMLNKCNKTNLKSQVASGHYSKLAASGDSSNLAASGHYSKLAAEGNNCVIAAIGQGSVAKGKKGTVIFLVEYDVNGKYKFAKHVIVDGKKIKENVFYTLKNKKFVEVK